MTAQSLAGLALGEQFAHADDRRQPRGQGRVELLVDGGVGFAQDVPPLAVAENDVFAAEIAEHGGAQFAGEGPVLFVVHVLGAQGDLRAGDRPAHGVEVAAWRTNGQIDAIDRLGPLRQPLPPAPRPRLD